MKITIESTSKVVEFDLPGYTRTACQLGLAR